MANITFANNAVTTLAGAISNVATTCNVAAGSGVLFPAVTTASAKYFCLTFTDAATGLLREITHVTNVSGDVFTIVRGQENTEALNWLAGALADNFWTAGSIEAVIASTQQFLTGNLSLYVSIAGSDSTGDGSIGNPWATPQHAFNYIQQYYNLSGFSITVNIANGTYTAASGTIVLNAIGAITGQRGTGSVQFIGNLSSPTSVIFNAVDATAINVSYGAQISVSGLQVTASGTPTPFNQNIGYGMVVGATSALTASSVDFSACGYCHLSAAGGALNITAYSLSGDAPIHLLAQVGGELNTSTAVVTINGSRTIATFAEAYASGTLAAYSMTFTGAGTVTGQRYSATVNGTILVNGAGANYFPGTTAGATSSGGQYG